MAIPFKVMLKALNKLSANLKNIIYVISGWDGTCLEQHLGHLRDVVFLAEHGDLFEGTWVHKVG